MGLKDRLNRLRRAVEGESISIPQQDGTVATFPPEDLEAAFANLVSRMGAGDDAPPEHPLLVAARNSSDPRWSRSFFATGPDVTEPPEPLYE